MGFLSFLRDKWTAFDASRVSAQERQLLMMGRLLSETVKAKQSIASLEEVEFRVFSQFGDDGIIQWLVNHVELPGRTFVEFGVEDYRESNTRFLMMNDNWSGLVMDGAESNVARIVGAEYFWRYDLTAKAAFIDKDNINDLLLKHAPGRELGLLHVDVDGNDYWIWNAIDAVSPVLVILEYNSVFGIDRAITVPYDKTFHRTAAHSSNLYFGASLRALHQLSERKGYAFIGCNSAGNNAYFVRRDRLNGTVRETSLERGYVLSKFRESRDGQGRLTYLAGRDRLEAVRGMPVFDVDSGRIEPL
ncbi:MAG TPA: hypothetical protein VEK79_02970 [Thermoanaerobaculia bacterium]|nr:hypothetical protein [Thermoanaerobaculia bacterium]